MRNRLMNVHYREMGWRAKANDHSLASRMCTIVRVVMLSKKRGMLLERLACSSIIILEVAVKKARMVSVLRRAFA